MKDAKNNIKDIKRKIEKEESNIKYIKYVKNTNKTLVIGGIIGLILLVISGFKSLNPITVLSISISTCVVYHQLIELIKNNVEIRKSKDEINNLNDLLKIFEK